MLFDYTKTSYDEVNTYHAVTTDHVVTSYHAFNSPALIDSHRNHTQ